MRLGSLCLFFAVCLFLLPASAEDIVVASYNVENYLRMDRHVDGRTQPDAPKPSHEVDAVVRILTEVRPDILGLCEIGDAGMLSDLQARLKAAGLDLPHREWLKGADAERHVALLSRFPITARNSRDDVSFELDGRLQRMPRGILDVTVTVNPGYRLRLVGAHLKSKRDVPGVDQASLRARESLALRKHLDSILAAAPDTNLMLFGDLNDTKNEPAIRQIIGSPGPAQMRDIWLRDSRGETWTQYWKTADLYSRFDYLLVSPGLHHEIIWKKCGINDSPSWDVASDHRAIFATISASERR